MKSLKNESGNPLYKLVLISDVLQTLYTYQYLLSHIVSTHQYIFAFLEIIFLYHLVSDFLLVAKDLFSVNCESCFSFLLFF